MIWGDLLLETVASREALRISLANAFGLQPTEVSVVDSASDLPEPGSVGVACEQSTSGGQFPWRLTVYTYINDIRSSRIDIVQRLARALETRCLMSDAEVDPYTMTLVTPEGTKSVNLDAQKLDMYDEYWLA